MENPERPNRKRSDREIVIARWADEDTWTIDTSDRVFAEMLRRKGYEPVERSAPYRRFRVPLRAVRVRSKAELARPRRQLTPEALEALRANMAKARAALEARRRSPDGPASDS